MELYEEQIRSRLRSDEEAFQAALAEIAGSVMGEKLTHAINNDLQIAKNAVDEILKYFHVKPQEVPGYITDQRAQLEYQLRMPGIMHSAARLEKDWRKHALGPMLGVNKETGNVVALLPNALNGYKYYDDGTWKQVTKKTESIFEDEVLCFYQPMPAGKMNGRKLLKFAMGVFSRTDLALITAATAMFTLVGLMVPKLSNFLLSVVVPTNSVNLYASTSVFLLCAAASIPMWESVKRLLVSRVRHKMDVTILSSTYMRLLCLPTSFYKGHSSGELASRMMMLNNLCSVLTATALNTGLTVLFSLAYVVQMFSYASALVLPAVATLALSAGLSFLTAVRKVDNVSKQMEAQAESEGLSFALYSGIQKIKLAGAEKRAFAKWTQACAKKEYVTYNPGVFLKLWEVFATAISLAGTILIYYCAVKSNVSVANFYTFMAAYAMVGDAFLTLSKMAYNAAQVKPILDMVEPILKAEPEVASDKTLVTDLTGAIELSHVTFRYRDDMPLILDDLSLKIHPGQYVAIVGYTGCGKSTLLRTLLGFETPQKGAVYYDGVDISRMDIRSLRQHIGVVTQNGDLFTGDIYSNITVSAPGLSMEDAWKAAEMAGIAEDIRHMPQGMHTHISEGGGGISGGQRQRLMIARAIAARPNILMFDEATSALDNLTQKQVSESLDSLHCTRIVIAHRLSTIRQCDRIIVLDKGRIVEDGSYEELIEKGGFFAELVSRQQVA